MPDLDETPEPPLDAALRRPVGTNHWAISSMVWALVSWATCLFFLGVLAAVNGHRALREIARTGENGRALAITGIVLGWTQLAAVLVVVAAFAVATLRGS